MKQKPASSVFTDMLLKWIFNILMVLWIYQAFVRPWLARHFQQPIQNPPPPNPGPNFQSNPSAPTPPKKQEDPGEYIDYEEVK